MSKSTKLGSCAYEEVRFLFIIPFAYLFVHPRFVTCRPFYPSSVVSARLPLSVYYPVILSQPSSASCQCPSSREAPTIDVHFVQRVLGKCPGYHGNCTFRCPTTPSLGRLENGIMSFQFKAAKAMYWSSVVPWCGLAWPK